MSTYSVATHGARSEAAVVLYTKSSTAFEAFVLQAEKLLKLDATTFTSDDAARVKLAIVLQVNLMIANDDVFQTRTLVKRGPRTDEYKFGSKEIDPRSQAIVEDLGISLYDKTKFATIRRLR